MITTLTVAVVLFGGTYLLTRNPPIGAEPGYGMVAAFGYGLATVATLIASVCWLLDLVP